MYDVQPVDDADREYGQIPLFRHRRSVQPRLGRRGRVTFGHGGGRKVRDGTVTRTADGRLTRIYGRWAVSG